MVLLFLIPLDPTILEAQESSGQGIRRLTHCIPTRPYLPTSEESTLCTQYPNLTEQTADVVIGNTSTVTRASDLTSSTWFDQEIIINGKFVIDQPTWFVRCVVKMAPAAEIEVNANNRMFTVFSKFFACTQMWKGITLLQDGDADIWHTEIQDAGVALRTTKDNAVSIVGSRFNRNHIGIQTKLSSSTSTSTLPTVFSPSYFANNEFTVTSALNAPYTGQVLHPTFFTIGMEVLNTTANLIASSAANGISGVASGLDINGCRFEGDDAQNYGVISSAIAGNSFDVNVRKCNFLMQGIATAAVALERGKNNSVRVESNYIEVESPSPSNGIFVYTPNGVSSTGGDCFINQDTIVFNENSTSIETNFGIKVVAGGGDRFFILNNIVELRTDKAEISAIVVEDATGTDKRISGNQVFNTLYPLTFNTALVGIDISRARNTDVCYNTVNNTRYGIRFYGDNSFTDLIQNEFRYHDYGLSVEGNQFDPIIPATNPAIIGVQLRGGNKWTTGDDGVKNDHAFFAGGEVSLSRMRVHSSDPVYLPFRITPSGWFVVNSGIPQTLCGNDLIVPGKIDSIVADGSYFLPSATPLVQWEMKRRLMYELLRDTNYGGTYAPFDTFYTNNLTTNAGKFAKVDWDLHKAGEWNASLRTALNVLEGQHKLYLDTLVNLSAGTAVLPDTVTLIDPVLAQAKTAVLTQMKTLHQQYFALTHAHDSLHRVALQTIRTFNSSIVAIHAFEVNQKVINEIAIKEALGEALTVSDMTALENIAAQPDSIAGSTQRTAANMLFPCIPHSVNPRTNEAEVNPAVQDEEISNDWTLSPNPTSGTAQLTFRTPYTGSLLVTDQFGRVVLRRMVQAQTAVQLEAAELPNGLYWIHAYSPAGEKQVMKMVIVH